MTNKSIIGNPKRIPVVIRDVSELIELADSYKEPVKPEEREEEGNKGGTATTNSDFSSNANIVKSDYIQIPNQNYVIAIGEADFGLDYENTHKQVLKKGLYVPQINQFMSFHNHIIDCYKNKKEIFDAEGNSISKKTKDDLYKRLTSNCWAWLNGKLSISDKNSIEYIIGLDSQDNFLTRKEDLEDCLMEDCYVDFTKLNSQGLPTIKYTRQGYIRGDNIYLWFPRNGAVASFFADSGRADLFCDRYPSYTDSSLGVFALAHADGGTREY